MRKTVLTILLCAISSHTALAQETPGTKLLANQAAHRASSYSPNCELKDGRSAIGLMSAKIEALKARRLENRKLYSAEEKQSPMEWPADKRLIPIARIESLALRLPVQMLSDKVSLQERAEGVINALEGDEADLDLVSLDETLDHVDLSSKNPYKRFYKNPKLRAQYTAEAANYRDELLDGQLQIAQSWLGYLKAECGKYSAMKLIDNALDAGKSVDSRLARGRNVSDSEAHELLHLQSLALAARDWLEQETPGAEDPVMYFPYYRRH